MAPCCGSRPPIIRSVPSSASADPESTVPIVGTKLHAPASVSGYRERPRISGLLDRGLEDSPRLTLLSAPPGYGKTVAVAGWLASRALAHAWLSLDAADNDLARFVRYLVAALRSVRTDAGEATLGLFGPGVSPSLDLIGATLLDEIAASDDPFVLVARRLPASSRRADPPPRPLPDRARAAVRPPRPAHAGGPAAAARPPAGPRSARRAAGRRPALHRSGGVRPTSPRRCPSNSIPSSSSSASSSAPRAGSRAFSWRRSRCATGPMPPRADRCLRWQPALRPGLPRRRGPRPHRRRPALVPRPRPRSPTASTPGCAGH